VAIGEAYVDIHGTTQSLRGEIKDGVNKGISGTGTEAGKKFTDEFGRELNPLQAVADKAGAAIAQSFERNGVVAGGRFTRAINSALEGLSRAKIAAPDLDTKVTEARIAQLKLKLADLGKMEVSPKVETDISMTLAQIARLEAKLNDVTNHGRGRDFSLKVREQDITQSLISLGALSRAITGLLKPVAIVGATPAIASLGYSAVQASGAIALIPAATATAALGIGTLATGFAHLGDALGPTGTPAQIKKVNEALAQLSPAARATVGEIRGLTDEWKALRVAVQERMFAGIADDVAPLAGIYFPMLREAMGQTASGFNAAAQEVAGFLRSSAGIDTMRTGMGGITTASVTLTQSLAPLSQIFFDLFAVGAQYMPQLASSFTNLIERTQSWVAAARQSGELNRIIDQALVVIGQLITLAGNLGSILYSIFEAGEAAGGNFLTTLTMVTGELARFLNSVEGQEALTAFFKAIHDTVAALLPGIIALGLAFGRAFVALGPVLPQLGEAFTALVVAAAPFIEAMAQLAAVILPPVISLITALAPVLGPVIAGFLAFYGAGTAVSAFAGVVAKMVSVSQIAAVATKAWTAAQWLFNAAMAANPITLVVIGLAALVAALVLAYQHSETFRNIVNTAFEAVSNAVSATITWFGQLPEKIGAAITSAGQWFGGLVDSAVQTGVEIGAWISSLPAMIGNGLSSLGNTIASAARTAWDWLVTTARETGTALTAWLAALPGEIAYGLGFLAGTIARGAVDAFNWLVTAATNAAEATVTFLVSLPDRFTGAMTALGTMLANGASAAFNWLVTSAQTAAENTVTFLVGFPARLEAWATDLATRFFNWSTAAWDQFQAGLSSAFTATVAWFASLPGIIGTFFTGLAADFMAWATAAWDGFQNGIVNAFNATIAWFTALPGRIGAFFAAAGTWLLQAGTDILNGLIGGLEAGWNAVWTWLGEMTARFIQGFKDAFGIASPSTIFISIGTDILTGLLNGLQAMVDVILAFVNTFITNFIAGFNNLQTMFVAIWQAIDAAVRTILDAIVNFIITSVTNFVNLVQTLLQGYSAFWSQIFNAILSLVTTVATAIADFVVQSVTNMYNLVMGVLNAVLAFWQQIWNAIFAFAQQIWQALVAFYDSGFTNWRQLFESVFNAAYAFWQSIWQAISDFARQIWDAYAAYFDGAINAFRNLIETVMNAISAFWDQIWTAIRNFAETTWNAFASFIDTGLNNLENLINTVMNAISAAWDRIWTLINDTGQRIWNNFWAFIQGALDTFGSRWDTFWAGVASSFDSLLSGIVGIAQRIWADVQGIFKTGVNLVISVVNWPINKINEVFSIQIPTIPDFQGFASGGHIGEGRVSGIGGRRGDREPALLSPEEHVWSAAEVAAAGGHAAVRRMRAQVLAGAGNGVGAGTLANAMQAARVNPDSLATSTQQQYDRLRLMDRYPGLDDIQKLAYGGVKAHVAWSGDEIQRIFGAMTVGGVGARANASDHPTGHALDFMVTGSKGDQIADHLYNNASQHSLKYEIWKQRIRYPAGGWSGMADRGSVTANHFDHVHASYMAIPGEVGTDAGGGVAAPVMPSFDGILEGAKAFLSGNMEGVPPFFGEMALHFLDATWEGLKNKATEMWNNIYASISGTVSGLGASLGLTGDNKQIVNRVAQERGWNTGNQWDALVQLVQKESSWSATADNPTSTAYGLFQFLDATWGTVGATKSSDPEAQARAGLAYIAQRYGDPVSALAHHNRVGSYDNGGWLRPGQMALNSLRTPEAVIPNPIDSFTRAFREVFGWLAPKMETALESGNAGLYDALIRRLGGEREVGGDIIRAYQRMPRWAQEMLQNAFPALIHAIKTPQVDIVDTIRDTFIPPKPLPAPPVVLPKPELPPVMVPDLPTGDIAVSFQNALSQFAPELSLALHAGAGDQARYLAQQILGNGDRVSAISAAMGTNVAPILQDLIDSLVPPVPPVVVPQPSWLEREIERLRQYAIANANKASYAGGRLDDLSWRIEDAFYDAFPTIERATQTSRIDVNRELAANATQILAWLQGRSAAEQVAILEALDGQDRSLSALLAETQKTTAVTTQTTQSPLIIESGALSVTIAGNADSVTVDQLGATLEAWSAEIIRQYEGRT
jgi:phage-related protein